MQASGGVQAKVANRTAGGGGEWLAELESYYYVSAIWGLTKQNDNDDKTSLNLNYTQAKERLEK